MRIERHCRERLPGGERLWRRAARAAGFTGRLRVEGLGRRRAVRRELESPERKRYGVTLGFYDREGITVFVGGACAYRGPAAFPRGFDPFETFCHELAHFRQEQAGTGFSDSVRYDLRRWRADPQERSADRYARRLARRLRGR